MIPYASLDISLSLQQRIQNATPQLKLALCAGTMCESDAERIGLFILLASEEDQKISSMAHKQILRWESKRLTQSLHRQSHSKILEYLTEFIPMQDELDQEIIRCVNINRRTIKKIARRCSSGSCEGISKGQQTLLLYPDILFDLQSNPRCKQEDLARATSFLTMQNSIPDGFVDGELSLRFSIENEIKAVLKGKGSPFLLKQQEEERDVFFVLENLGSYSYDFVDEDLENLAFTLKGQGLDDNEEESKSKNLDAQIRDMSVGQKIKLAYKGNKTARSILVRDTNKSVAVAVIKSGKVTDSEAAHYAGNKSVCDDVIREIARNKEFMRKYSVQVALANNPKAPAGVVMRLLGVMSKKDLQMLQRNRGISSAIRTAAKKLYAKKYSGG